MTGFASPSWHPEQIPKIETPAWRFDGTPITEAEAAQAIHEQCETSSLVLDIDGQAMRLTAVDEFVILEAA